MFKLKVFTKVEFVEALATTVVLSAAFGALVGIFIYTIWPIWH